MSAQLFDSRPMPGRAVSLNLDATIEVDRNRDRTKLLDDILNAIDQALTAHGRTGSIEFARLAGGDDLMGRMYVRRETA
jgi:hypothetical protein